MHLGARRFVALALCVAVVAVAPGRAMAHTELEFSLPANGTTVGDPVAEITIGFTDLVALVGNGFEVHDPQGNLLTPFVVTDDGKVFKFQLDPPLAGGLVVVDYHVRTLDGDEQQGSFSFTVAATLPTTAPPVPTSAPAATSAPATTDATTSVPGVIAPPPSPATPSTATQSTAPATTLPTQDSDSNSERTLMFAVLIGIAALAAGFLLIRSRRAA